MPFLFWKRKRGSVESNRFDGYQIIKVVHDGHKATVFQARYHDGEMLYAVKLYKKEYDQEARRVRKKYSLWSEGEIGQAMNPMPNENPAEHPIVRTVDEGHENGKSSAPYYVVQEFVDGPNLKNILTVRPKDIENRRYDVALGIVQGLDVIHRSGFVHRDLCADNVLLTTDWRTKLIDLGFCCPSGMKFEEKTGTPSYMAPEQIRGDELTPATDIYALGVILYEMFTGRLPFGSGAQGNVRDQRGNSLVLSQHLGQKARPPRQVNPDCPEEVAEIIERCMEKDPGKRIQDALTLMRCLSVANARAQKQQ